MNIDISYFVKGRRRILNASTGTEMLPNKNNQSVNMAVTAYIDEYSPMFLRMVVGELADKILEDDGSDEHLCSIFDALKEPLADYVMFHILRYSGQKATVEGVYELKSGNTIVSPAVYQANLWNEMVDKLRIFKVKYPEMRVDNNLLQKITSTWI